MFLAFDYSNASSCRDGMKLLKQIAEVCISKRTIQAFAVNDKGKVNHVPQQSVGGCSSPSFRPWARRWRTTNVCDAWPVWRQTYGYLPSCKASPPIGWYQIILLGDRGTCVLITCPVHSSAGQLGFEPATYWSQVQHPSITPPNHKVNGEIIK